MRNSLATKSSMLLGDNRLLQLERRWIRHFSTFEHTTDTATRRKAQALLLETEQDIAMTPAESRRGMAVKIRCCLGREEREIDSRPWAQIFRSLLNDVDG